jgi:hypothetical protein
MTTQALAAPPARTICDGRLAGLAGVLAAGVAQSTAGVDAASLPSPILVLFIASSALGFRLAERG